MKGTEKDFEKHGDRVTGRFVTHPLVVAACVGLTLAGGPLDVVNPTTPVRHKGTERGITFPGDESELCGEMPISGGHLVYIEGEEGEIATDNVGRQALLLSVESVAQVWSGAE